MEAAYPPASEGRTPREQAAEWLRDGVVPTHVVLRMFRNAVQEKNAPEEGDWLQVWSAMQGSDLEPQAWLEQWIAQEESDP